MKSPVDDSRRRPAPALPGRGLLDAFQNPPLQEPWTEAEGDDVELIDALVLASVLALILL